MASNSYWIDAHGMLLGPKKEWEFIKYGFYPEGRGDACWRTSLALIAYPAIRHIFFTAVKEMQEKSLRYLGPVMTRTPGRNKNGFRYSKPNHPHRHFSRDQRIMGVAALYLTGRSETLAGLDMWQPCDPRYSKRPGLKNWLNYCQSVARYGHTEQSKNDAKKFHKWVWWEINLLGPPKGFPLHLLSWMLYVCPDEQISEYLLDNAIPDWNLLLILLNGGIVSQYQVDSYRSKDNFQWQSTEWKDPSKYGHGSYLPENDEFQLDKDVLKWVWNQEIKYK